MHTMKLLLKEKMKEAIQSVVPITTIVLVLVATAAPIPNDMLLAFVIGAVMLVIGMSLFTLGADMSMEPMGEYVGSHMTKSKNVWMVVAVSFFVGVMITVSEPDLQVLANQVPTVPNMTLILCVAVGVGLFLVVAMLRILFGIRLRHLLVVFYPLVFLLAAFVEPSFLAVAFDAGGVTTGPMTVPFILALGVGVASIRSDKHAENDSFGMVALSSIGPILAVLLLGLIYEPHGAADSVFDFTKTDDSKELFALFGNGFPHYLKEVMIAVAPIVVFFFIYQLIVAPLKKERALRISVGVVYTYLGLVLFLTGVNVGFMPVGYYLGGQLGSWEWAWLVIPIGMLIGYFIVAAEPAVHVLTKQVEEITSGAIPTRALKGALGIGVSVSVGLAMIRVLTGISIFWFILPGYAIAIGLSFVVPKIFVSIAFDSGGVASGPMTATFLLPFAMGVCTAVGGNAVTDAFGVVAMVAMTPLIAIQILGFTYQRRIRKMEAAEMIQPLAEEEIIDLW